MSHTAVLDPEEWFFVWFKALGSSFMSSTVVMHYRLQTAAVPSQYIITLPPSIAGTSSPNILFDYFAVITVPDQTFLCKWSWPIHKPLSELISLKPASIIA